MTAAQPAVTSLSSVRVDRRRKVNGDLIRAARFAAGFSQFQIAASAGVSLKVLNLAERHHRASPRVIRLLADVLKVAPDSLEVDPTSGEGQAPAPHEFRISEDR